MIVYIDTSVVLRLLFREKGAWKAWSRWRHACSSELSRVEARRAIDRLRLEARLGGAAVAAAHDELRRLESGIAFIALTRDGLERAAAPMPTVLKTLHAIHLASALLFRDAEGVEPTFMTQDRGLSLAARGARPPLRRVGSTPYRARGRKSLRRRLLGRRCAAPLPHRANGLE